MIGNNELRLCSAELNAAVDLYLRTKMLKEEYVANVVVQSVAREGNGYSDAWIVKLGEKPVEPAA